MLGEDLAYVALVVRDLDAASAVFGKHLGMHRTEMEADGDKLPVFSIGQSALALFPVGHAYVDGFDKPGVHHIALGASRLEPAVAEAKAAGAAASGKERASLNGGRRIALDPQGTASIKT
jgi:catechol 2,3-dioxygenase-like lactoylglutathione lyase family enzyme